MIKKLFSLRVISLAAILSNLTFSGGASLLPQAIAQPDYTEHLRQRDLFCDEGTKIIGFPYGLFDWGDVPWGMPGEEFIHLFEDKIRQCTRDVWSGSTGIDTYKTNPISGGMTSVNFEFEGENYTLSRIEIGNNGAVKHYLLEQFGLPQNAKFVDTYVPVGCVKEGIACRRIFDYGGKSLEEGAWRLNDTWIMVSRGGLTITLVPVEPSLRSIERPYCTRFIVFKVCD